jgi:hypothetical protein
VDANLPRLVEVDEVLILLGLGSVAIEKTKGHQYKDK